MLCEECNERDAQVFITQIISGEVIDLQLCRECAGPLADESDEAWASSHPAAPRNPGPLLAIPPDPTRPAVVDLPEKITVRELAGVLKVRPFYVIGALMEINVFCSIGGEIDFSTAAHVCSRCHVIARRKEE